MRIVNMKIVLKTITIAILLGFLLAPVFGFAQNPSIPNQFYGLVSSANETISDGVVVEAKINGIVMGSSAVAGGKYGYGSNNLLFALDNQGINAGKTVEFYVNGIKANETAIFANGDSNQINLTVSEVLPFSPPPATGGGGGALYIPPAIPLLSLSAEAQKVDANKDDKIDILDFNTLMVHWGSTSAGNIANFNGDGKVDIFDFNLLMIHWTT